ncbi:hypothetical protein ACKRZS_009522 [Fusarium odoratissimum]
MGSSLIKRAGITIQTLSPVSTIYHDNDALKQFETCRQSANGHLNRYFKYIGHEKIQYDLAGLYARPLQPRGSEADQNARLSQTNAIQDLVKLDAILGQIKQQERSYITAISPLIVPWMAICFTLPYVTLQGDPSVFFKIGAVSGAFAIAAQLVRKFLQLRKITPLQHKVRGLARAFKNGTIRYRDMEEVMISSLK